MFDRYSPLVCNPELYEEGLEDFTTSTTCHVMMEIDNEVQERERPPPTSSPVASIVLHGYDFGDLASPFPYVGYLF